jgi:hypothetical protein
MYLFVLQRYFVYTIITKKNILSVLADAKLALAVTSGESF